MGAVPRLQKLHQVVLVRAAITPCCVACKRFANASRRQDESAAARTPPAPLAATALSIDARAKSARPSNAGSVTPARLSRATATWGSMGKTTRRRRRSRPARIRLPRRFAEERSRRAVQVRHRPHVDQLGDERGGRREAGPRRSITMRTSLQPASSRWPRSSPASAKLDTEPGTRGSPFLERRRDGCVSLRGTRWPARCPPIPRRPLSAWVRGHPPRSPSAGPGRRPPSRQALAAGTPHHHLDLHIRFILLARAPEDRAESANAEKSIGGRGGIPGNVDA